MMRFLDDAFALDFLATRVGAVALFNTAYTPVDFNLQSVAVSRVVRREFEAPTFETVRSTGSDEKITPTSERVMSERSTKNQGRLVWVDVALAAVLAATVETTVLEPESVVTRDLLTELGGAATIAELRAKLLTRYTQSQLDEIFAKLRITTIDEFKERMNLFVQFTYKEPPAFNPADPASARNFPLDVCVTFQPELNVADALRNAKLSRAIRARETTCTEEIQGAELKTSSVFVTVFPDSVAVDDAIPGMTAAQIKASVQSLFAAEKMLAHFLAP